MLPSLFLVTPRERKKYQLKSLCTATATAATTVSIARAYIGGLNIIGRDRPRNNSIDDVGSLAKLANLTISSLQACGKVCDTLVFSIGLHLAKLIKNFLSIAGSVSGNSASVLRVLITYCVNVAISFAAILLSCRLFILHLLRFPRKFRLYLHPQYRGRALVSRLLLPILTR